MRVLDAPDGEAGVLHRPVLLPDVPGLVRARMYTSASVRSASTSFLPLCCRYGYNPTRRGNCLLSMRARILGRDPLRYRPQCCHGDQRTQDEIHLRPLQHRERARQTGRFTAHSRLLGFCFQEARSGRNAKGGTPMNFRTLVGAEHIQPSRGDHGGSEGHVAWIDQVNLHTLSLSSC